ncbi:MAG: hypothetical protein E7291_07465 [Lachnospiraceae bacterium]|nr:hypothetical protein [Lachnospiraceae bacterium]
MVHSVLAVSSADKVKRDTNKSEESYHSGKQSKPLFAQILEQCKEEIQSAPAECYTVTYGQDSKLRTFQYRMREYNY